MKALILAALLLLSGVAQAAETPFAWARNITGTFIVLLEEPCEVFKGTQQYIIVDSDHRILAGGCWLWKGNTIYARDGRTLHPVQWPVADFNQWRKDLK